MLLKSKRVLPKYKCYRQQKKYYQTKTTNPISITTYTKPSPTKNSRSNNPYKNNSNQLKNQITHNPPKEKKNTKGIPWTEEEENTLRALVKANTPLETIAIKLNKKPATIYVKCLRLGITETPHSIPLNVPLPKELPSIEETLRKLAIALDTASTPGLDKIEVQRLQVVATLSKTYKETLADYINYRQIELRLNQMEAKYDQLLKETSKDNAPKPDNP